MIVPDKNDITIPQGIAHAVDRVMFPLPVGDILQTLQSDREHRFTIFLKALFSSGVSEILQNKGLNWSHNVTMIAEIKCSNFTRFRSKNLFSIRSNRCGVFKPNTR